MPVFVECHQSRISIWPLLPVGSLAVPFLGFHWQSRETPLRVILSRSVCLQHTYGALSRSHNLIFPRDLMIDVSTMYARPWPFPSRLLTHVSASHSDSAYMNPFFFLPSECMIRVHWEEKKVILAVLVLLTTFWVFSASIYELGDIHAINPSFPRLCFVFIERSTADSSYNSDAHVPYPRTHRVFHLFRSKDFGYSVDYDTFNINQVSTSDPCLSLRSAYSPFVLNTFSLSRHLLSPWAETKLLLDSLYRFRCPQHIRGDLGESDGRRLVYTADGLSPRYSTTFGSEVFSVRYARVFLIISLRRRCSRYDLVMQGYRLCHHDCHNRVDGRDFLQACSGCAEHVCMAQVCTRCARSSPAPRPRPCGHSFDCSAMIGSTSKVLSPS